MTDYIQMVLDEQYEVDLLYHDCIVEQMENEAEFLLSCFENNIILEAPIVKKDGKDANLWDRIIAFFKELYNKFFANVNALIEKNREFVETQMVDIKSFDFTGLSVKCIPYWLGKEVIDTLPAEITRTIVQKKPPIDKLSEYNTKEQVETFDSFSKLHIDGVKYSKAAKIKFTGGLNAKEMPAPVILRDKEFKSKAKEMMDFVQNFQKIYRVSKSAADQLTIFFKKVKTDGEKAVPNAKATSESFSLLEGTYYKDTDLKYCTNANILFEDGENQQSQQNNSENNNSQQSQQNNSENNNGTQQQKDEQKLNSVTTDETKVKDESKDESKDGEGTENKTPSYETFYKHAAQLAQVVVAASMTVSEQTYLAYISILKNVYKAKTKNKIKDKPITKPGKQYKKTKTAISMHFTKKKVRK